MGPEAKAFLKKIMASMGDAEAEPAKPAKPVVTAVAPSKDGGETPLA
jgi:hypothetical protein